MTGRANSYYFNLNLIQSTLWYQIELRRLILICTWHEIQLHEESKRSKQSKHCKLDLLSIIVVIFVWLFSVYHTSPQMSWPQASFLCGLAITIYSEYMYVNVCRILQNKHAFVLKDIHRLITFISINKLYYCCRFT